MIKLLDVVLDQLLLDESDNKNRMYSVATYTLFHTITLGIILSAMYLLYFINFKRN